MSTDGTGGADRAQLAAALGVAKLEDADHERVLELAAMLAEVVTNFDQLAWGTWKAVAPSSPIKRQQNLKQLIGRYAAGDKSVNRAQVRQEMDRLRQLGGALIASLNQAGRQYAQRHAATMLPAQIEAAVRTGGKSVMTGHEVQCWRKYVELAGTQDADAVEREIMGSMASHAEALMKGSGVR